MYGSGDEVSVTVTFNDLEPSAQEIEVAVAASLTADVERLVLQRKGAGVYTTTAALPLTASDGSTPGDDVLFVLPGTPFHAIYYVDRDDPALKGLTAHLYSDIAFLERLDEPTVIPKLALTPDEAALERQTGTLLRAEGLPVQVATEEVIFWERDAAHRQEFLERTGGEVIATTKLEPMGSGESYHAMHLVKVKVPAAAAKRLAMLEEFFDEQSPLVGSNEGALGIVSFVLELQLDGYPVALNPRLQYQAEPVISPAETAKLTHSMQNRGPSGSSTCLPNDPSQPCVENVPALWAYLALFGADQARVNVAVLDMGFATHEDYRAPATGSMVECDMTTHPPRCGPGAAQGAPTVGNSLFGGRSWHGSGVVQTMGGVVNNGLYAAGVGGQVAVPMLYKYDTASYAFDIGAGIRKAVGDGASCINVSAGYPCRILTNAGPDFDICSPIGRAGICSLVSGSLAAAAGAVCAATAWIPFAGAIACGAASTAVVAATETCIATLAFGNLAGPMASAVRYAASHGVPVVTIAGNRLPPGDLPEVIRDYVSLHNQRTEDWRIMPAMAPEAIVVGAVNGSMDNEHFIGNRVDLWAPIRSTYFAPKNEDDPASPIEAKTIGGTSAAAPYVAGVIAAMQAINPDLDPRSSHLSALERQAIVPKIRSLLLSDDFSFSNAELVALGFNNDPERRQVVDPLSAVQAAAALRSVDPIPDLQVLGFDATVGFSEQLRGSDDVPAAAQMLSPGVEVSGTIVAIPDPAGLVSMPDEDWYRFTMPSGPRAQEAVIRIVSLAQGHRGRLPRR